MRLENRLDRIHSYYIILFFLWRFAWSFSMAVQDALSGGHIINIKISLFKATIDSTTETTQIWNWGAIFAAFFLALSLGEILIVWWRKGKAKEHESDASTTMDNDVESFDNPI